MLPEYRKVDEQMIADKKGSQNMYQPKNTEEKSLERASSLTSISSKIIITQSNDRRLKNHFK